MTYPHPIDNPGSFGEWSDVLRDDFNGAKGPYWLNGFSWGNSHPTDTLQWNRDDNYKFTTDSIKLVTKKEDYTAPGGAIYHLINRGDRRLLAL